MSADHDKRLQREAPTYEELQEFAAGLPPDEAKALLARARPAPRAPELESPGSASVSPVYVSWEDFLDRTTLAERMAWCRKKATRANRPRLMSGPPDVKITGADVWTVLEAAKGRCEYCGSLAVENRPSGLNGKPLPWAQVGRRIGSLGHRVARFNGGSNAPGNLSWTCLWCNTWPDERRPGTTDHGGLQPEGDLCGIPGCGVVRPKDADLPLQPDHCPEHGGTLGELCATCLSVMRKVWSKRCLDTRTSLREAYRQQHNQCPGCDPLTVLPTLGEVHGCRKIVTAPAGDKGFHARHDALLTGWPGNFTDQHWVEETRNAAEAAGLAIDEYVLKTAQVPHRCGQCEADAMLVPENVTWITDELVRLRRVHESLYSISFDPLSMHPWRAKALGARRKSLDADSPGGLRLRIGEDKRAAARRASRKPSQPLG